jgi:hypothetical protein
MTKRSDRKAAFAVSTNTEIIIAAVSTLEAVNRLVASNGSAGIQMQRPVPQRVCDLIEELAMRLTDAELNRIARGDDPERRLAALRTIAELRDYPRWESRPNDKGGDE